MAAEQARGAGRLAIAGMGYRLAAGGLGRRPTLRVRDEDARLDDRTWQDDDLWPEDQGPCLEDALVQHTARAWTRLSAATGRMARARLAAWPPGWMAAARLPAVSARTACQMMTVCVVAALGCSTWLCWEQAQAGGPLSAARPTVARTASLAPAAAHGDSAPPPAVVTAERTPDPAPRAAEPPSEPPVVEASAAPVREATVQRTWARAVPPPPRLVRLRAVAAPPRAVAARVTSVRFDLPDWLTRPQHAAPPPVRIMSPPPHDLSLPVAAPDMPHPPLVVAGPRDRFAART